jgi:hypothetical protein
MAATITSNASLLASLIAYYKLDGNANDAHTNLLNGTAIGTPTWPTALLRQGVQVNGSSQCINLGTNALFSPTAISISAWVYLAATPSGLYSIITKRTAFSTWADLQWAAAIDSARKVRFEVGLSDITGVTVLSASALTLSTWYHVACVYDGTDARIYLNGYLNNVVAGAGAIHTKTYPCVIGARADGSTPWTGRADYSNSQFDEITLASSAWTPEEVRFLYHSGYPVHYDEVRAETLLSPPVGASFPGGVENLAEFEASVEVQQAVATACNKVKVYYTTEMNHEDPEAVADALNPSNYLFTGVVAIAAASVALVTSRPTIVEITLVGEQTEGADYSVTVENVTSLSGSPLVNNYATFWGIGVAPTVTDAEVLEDYKIRITFDKPMKADLARVDPDNYVFTDGLEAQSVEPVDTTHVDIITGEMVTGHVYTVTVSYLRSIYENVIAAPPDNQHNFTGAGLAPQLNDAAIRDGDFNVFIDFSENMRMTEAEDVDHYAIDPELPIASVTQVTDTRYTVEFEEYQVSAAVYTITATGIHDLAGNLIDPEHDTAAFIGARPSIPLLSIYPVNGSIDLPSHTVIRVRAVDDRPNFSGINPTTWNITITFDRVTQVVMQNGVFDAGLFEGGISGDPQDATAGLLARFRPRYHYWEEGAAYQISASVHDQEGTASSATWYLTFSAKNDEFFEDNPIAEANDTKIATTVLARYPNSEQVRQLFLRLCSRSVNPTARARTLLWYASSTGIRPLIAPLVNVSIASGTNLGYRVGVLELQTELARYTEQVNKAFGEMNSFYSDEIMKPVEEYLRSADSTKVISAIAALVVLAVYA